WRQHASPPHQAPRPPAPRPQRSIESMRHLAEMQLATLACVTHAAIPSMMKNGGRLAGRGSAGHWLSAEMRSRRLCGVVALAGALILLLRGALLVADRAILSTLSAVAAGT